MRKQIRADMVALSDTIKDPESLPLSSSWLHHGQKVAENLKFQQAYSGEDSSSQGRFVLLGTYYLGREVLPRYFPCISCRRLAIPAWGEGGETVC